MFSFYLLYNSITNCKSIGKNNYAGYVKLQREEETGFKAVLQTSKGVQEIFIKIKKGFKETVKKEIKSKF